VADLHGYLPEIPKCDVLMIGGDLGPATSSYHFDDDRAALWLATTFTDWLSKVPAKAIVGIAGNHDFYCQINPDAMHALPWIYLCDSGCEIGGSKFWGSPWTPDFMNWAFMKRDEELAERWALIPEDTDVLITHGPPLGLGDTNIVGRHCGSETLKQWRVNAAKLPDIHFFGHIHEGHGQAGDDWANVSYVDEQYRPTGPIRVVELPE
jgi:Icc-related predicted phosphoesterase